MPARPHPSPAAVRTRAKDRPLRRARTLDYTQQIHETALRRARGGGPAGRGTTALASSAQQGGAGDRGRASDRPPVVHGASLLPREHSGRRDGSGTGDDEYPDADLNFPSGSRNQQVTTEALRRAQSTLVPAARTFFSARRERGPPVGEIRSTARKRRAAAVLEKAVLWRVLLGPGVDAWSREIAKVCRRTSSRLST